MMSRQFCTVNFCFKKEGLVQIIMFKFTRPIQTTSQFLVGKAVFFVCGIHSKLQMNRMYPFT